MRSLLVHSGLLVIQSLAVVAYNVPYELLPDLSTLIALALLFVDTFVQLLISYICWTLGASDQLKNFQCSFVEDSSGNLVL